MMKTKATIANAMLVADRENLVRGENESEVEFIRRLGRALEMADEELNTGVIKERKQVIIGNRTDLGGLLAQIGTWPPGAEQVAEHFTAVQYALDEGLIVVRKHYDAAHPDGANAFEVTDAGLDKLKELHGDEMAQEASRIREFHRNESTQEAFEEARRVVQRMRREQLAGDAAFIERVQEAIGLKSKKEAREYVLDETKALEEIEALRGVG